MNAKTRLVTALISFSLLGVGLAYFYWPEKDHEIAVDHRMDELQNLNDKIVHAPLPVGQTVKRDPQSHKLATAIELSKEYQTTRDMHDIYVKYRHSTNPDEKYFAFRAMEFCSRFLLPSKRNTFVAAPEKLWNGNPERDIVEHNLFARCSEFKEFASNHDFREELKSLEQEVNESDSNIVLANKSANLLMLGKVDDARALAKQVLLSQEPDAIASLETYLKQYKNEQMKLLPDYKPGQAQPTDTSSIALALAACDLGKDCSKDSEEAESICTWGGACGEDLIDQKLKTLTQAEAEEVRRKKDQYVSAIKSGDLTVFGFQ